MYANRYASHPNSRRSDNGGASLRDAEQPTTTERLKRFANFLENRGIEVRIEKEKSNDSDVKWIG
jgi:hypothetical protein